MKMRRANRAPRSRDLSRLVLARASARLSVERANGVFADSILDAFRAEIGATVRLVSPLLLALLEHEGIAIDDLACRLRPAEGWPHRPRLPAAEVRFRAMPEDLVWPIVSSERVGRPFATPVDEWHGVEIGNGAGDTIAIHVVDHSLEVAARLRGAWYTTLFGAAQVEVPGATLARMSAARPGRPLEEALSLPAIRGRGWVVEGAFDRLLEEEVEITAVTGMRRYRMPWVR